MGCGRQGTTDCCQDIGCKGKGDEEREGDAAAAVFAACAFGRFHYVEYVLAVDYVRMTHLPPLSGPSRLMMPSSCIFFRCLDTALRLMPRASDI